VRLASTAAVALANRLDEASAPLGTRDAETRYWRGGGRDPAGSRGLLPGQHRNAESSRA